MQIGFITNSLMKTNELDVEQIADWALENGFTHLEVGPSVALERKTIEGVLAKGIKISDFLYCRNYLLPEEKEFHEKQLYARIDMASDLGVPYVVTSTGIDRGIDFDESGFNEHDAIRKRPIRSLDRVVENFKRYLDYAQSKNVGINLELCPLMGNIAISPYLLTELFKRLPDQRLGVAYDPSHLVWEMMDPYDFIFEFKDRIRHVHGKDTEILRGELRRRGILSDFDWWRYRIPGLGELDWKKIVSRLQEVGYDGVISIEHEDPVWEGSAEKVKKGILIGKHTIEKALDLEKY